jgi:predicted acyltransferase
MYSTTAPRKETRLLALDILRGLAIFGMILSAQLPASLPIWMHHDQWFDANGVLHTVIGLTWVDMVFPFFLFSMGAAIPFALGRRLEKGSSYFSTVGHILWRGIVIMAFAIYLGNSSAWGYGRTPDLTIWLRTIAGFLGLVLFLGRLPFEEGKPEWVKPTIKGIGLVLLIGLMATLRKADGTGFDQTRNDIIIMVLGIDYIIASFVWMVSRNNFKLRVALIAGMFAIRFHHLGGGPLYPAVIPWFSYFNWGFLPNATFHAIPVMFGTLVGDLLRGWSLKEKNETRMGLDLSPLKIGLLLILTPLITIGGLYFLQTRYVYSGMLFTVSCLLIIHALLAKADSELTDLMKELLKYAAFFLVIGYIIEPFEGGIKKQPSTPAYYFICMGMASALLIGFTLVVDGLKKGFWLGFLRVVGSNPMLAYIMGNTFVFPIFHLTGLMKVMEPLVAENVPMGTVWAIVLTLSSIGVTYLFTRAKIILRV